MCLSNNPQEPVNFHRTTLVGLEVQGVGADGKPINQRILGYSNVMAIPRAVATPGVATAGDVAAETAVTSDAVIAVSDPALDSVLDSVLAPGNAMLLAVPALPGSLGPSSLIPLASYPHIFRDFADAIRIGVSLSVGSGSADDGDAVVVTGYDAGLYDVVIASSASAIAQALTSGKVSPNKTPVLNQVMYDQLDKLYPGFSFLLFCFDPKDSGKVGGVMVQYTPMVGSEDIIFLPGLDGHSGSIEMGMVALDHTIIVGSYRMEQDSGSVPWFTDPGVAESHPQLSCEVIGMSIAAGTMAPQGDFVLRIDDVGRGAFSAKREKPPGWTDVFGSVDPQEPSFYITDPSSAFDGYGLHNWSAASLPSGSAGDQSDEPILHEVMHATTSRWLFWGGQYFYR